MNFLTISMFLIIAISAISANILKNADTADIKIIQDDKTILIFRILMPLTVILAFLVSYLDPCEFELSHEETIKINFLAISLFIFGMSLRWFAILSLKKAFTVKVTILKNHELKTNGIYKWIRHPSYTGIYIYGLGYGLAFQSILCVFLILFGVFISTFSRIKVEEKVLENHFGEEYQKYKLKSWRLFPGIY